MSGRIVATTEKPAVHLGMQCLDPAIHHLGKAGVVGHIADGDAGLFQVPPGAAGAEDLDAAGGQRRAKSTRPVLSLTLIKARCRGGEVILERGWRDGGIMKLRTVTIALRRAARKAPWIRQTWSFELIPTRFEPRSSLLRTIESEVAGHDDGPA